MMYAIGVEPTENSMVQGGEFFYLKIVYRVDVRGHATLKKKIAMSLHKRMKPEKMVNFLLALSKMIGRTVASIEFLFSNGSGDEGGSFIESDELYAIIFKLKN